MRYSRCVACHGMVGWIGLMANLALSGLKLFVGIVAGSQALVVDALYSAKDVVTSLLILVGLKYSKQPLDREHQFGHGKAEFLLSAAVSLLLMGVTGLLFFLAAGHLIEGEHRPPHLIALWAALFSMVACWFVYRYTRCVAVEINSSIVMTLAKHTHGDGLSSGAVAVGIVGSHYLGMPWLDTVVALGETLHLLYLGGEVFWEAFQGLMDSAAPKGVQDQIWSQAAEVRGVRSVDQLRTRRVGQEIWVDLVVGVDPDLSVHEARQVAKQVESVLSHAIPHIGDISVQFQSLSGSVPELKVMRAEIAKIQQQRQLKRSSRAEEDFF
ncbi:MAG: magnetosome biogenesis CDF transporter MamM [Magnetococcales bacterium]|nr:magnetosome biogenesis CDF transporter MamM [Magnetococcales bacterium]